ncbi:hypothetical protein Tco_0804321 [Tanacetum coccineum]|uniref:Uncharacterized protein n=1 Tax=Tanacetum coccineum TaxID=301880 RepID=A0ABQ5A8I0_9ASTR
MAPKDQPKFCPSCVESNLPSSTSCRHLPALTRILGQESSTTTASYEAVKPHLRKSQYHGHEMVMVERVSEEVVMNVERDVMVVGVGKANTLQQLPRRGTTTNNKKVLAPGFGWNPSRCARE